MKNAFHVFIGRLDMAENRVSVLEDIRKPPTLKSKEIKRMGKKKKDQSI